MAIVELENILNNLSFKIKGRTFGLKNVSDK